MSTARQKHPISVTDYLEGEKLASAKHEFVDGVVYRRADEGFARESYEGPEAVVPLPEIECSLSLAEVYAQVDFTSNGQ